ncbi:hypothetical protein [Streptomyces sp. HB132]|uniref:hypothetical protein n=1 Tax=Streptomyces sp. HB132 TaxID=767388 RepID=UPI00195F79A9|nr:hypothetical protein [Streptomyces sp. HB132]MBM7437150.1 hypothetical protein [Streptomyces sp. HB132]
MPDAPIAPDTSPAPGRAARAAAAAVRDPAFGLGGCSEGAVDSGDEAGGET